MERGPWYDLVRQHFGLQSDLDLCAAIYGDGQAAEATSRSLRRSSVKRPRQRCAGHCAVPSSGRRAGANRGCVYDSSTLRRMRRSRVLSEDVQRTELLLEPFLATWQRTSEHTGSCRPAAAVAGAALYAAS